MNEVRRGPGRDRLDSAIDDAARRMVASHMPPPLVRAVVSAIEGQDAPGGRVRRWRLALGTASIAASVAVASLIWIRSDRDAGDSSAPSAAVAPPHTADGPVVVEQRALSGAELLEGWVLPGPVKVAPVSVAPVTIRTVKVAPVEVARVEVAAVTVSAR